MSTRFKIGPTTFLSTVALWEALQRGGAPVDPAPLNTVRPFISGTLTAGNELTCNPGVWYGNPHPTFTYQWQQWNGTGWDDIVGATGQSYTTSVEDDYQCLVTGTNVHGSTVVASDTVGVVPALTAPRFSTNPTISGNTTTGSTLTLNPGTWTGNPNPIAAYQWQKFNSGSGLWENLSGQTGTTYVAAADGEYRAQVTLTNSQGSTSAVSASIVIGTSVAPSNMATPLISGNAYSGSTLYGIKGVWADADTFTYQWQTQNTSTQVWSDVSGATSLTYTTVSAAPHRLVVRATNAVSTVEAISNTLTTSAIPSGTTVVTHYNTSFTSQDSWVIPADCTISGGAFNFKNNTTNVTASRDISSLNLPAGTYTIEHSILAGDGASTRGNVTVRLNSSTYPGTTRTDMLGTFTDTITIPVAVTGLEIRVTRQSNLMDIKVGHLTLRSETVTQTNQAPSLDYPPQLRGTPETNNVLETTRGVWFSNPEVTYAIQWQKFNATTQVWENITGATSASYTPVNPGDYRSSVTVTNAHGSSTSNSSTITVTGTGQGETPPPPPPPPPANTYTKFMIEVMQTAGAPTVSIASLTFRSAANGPAIVPTAFSASTEALPAANAFDSDSTTWWNSQIGDTLMWIQQTNPEAVPLGSVTIRYPDIEPGYTAEAPRDFLVRGFNGVNWVILMQIDGISFTPGQERTWIYEN